jgi:hypothetical protein
MAISYCWLVGRQIATQWIRLQGPRVGWKQCLPNQLASNFMREGSSYFPGGGSNSGRREAPYGYSSQRRCRNSYGENQNRLLQVMSHWRPRICRGMFDHLQRGRFGELLLTFVAVQNLCGNEIAA